MTYYEELGVRQDAAIEEIRQAYKVLARLLHPDGQSDARLKAMAECQMKRLNEILAILTDSQKRRQYDESLRESPKAALEWAPQPEQPAYWYRILHFGLRHWFWILIGMVVAGVGLWCLLENAPEAARVLPMRQEAVPGEAGTGEPIRRPVPLSPGNAIKPQAAQAPHAVTTVPRETPPPSPSRAAKGPNAQAEANPPEPSRSFPAQELPVPPAIAVAEPPRVTPAVAKVDPPRAISPANRVSFAGNWFYAPDAAAKVDPNLYPATSVEFVLVEENGSLVGNYRARYKIPDRAISPEVQFRAQGKSSTGKSCKLTWVSEDGAQGEAELTLRTSNQMNVTWWTTVFGRRAALSSGMAVLIRQQAP